MSHNRDAVCEGGSSGVREAVAPAGVPLSSDEGEEKEVGVGHLP